MVVVPRLFEVLRQRILNQVEKQGKLTNYLMGRALAIGAKGYPGSVPLWDKPMDLFLGAHAAAQDRGQVRRADQGDGLGRRAAQSRGRHLLPFARPHPAAGLWPDRMRRRCISCNRPKRRAQDGHGRAAAAQHRGEDRRGRRDPGPGRARHARLLAQRGADRAHADRRLAAHRRRRPSRREGPDRHHRPQEGHDRQRQGRQCRAAEGRGDADPPARDRPGDGGGRQAALSGRPDRPRSGMDAPNGARRTSATAISTSSPTTPIM